MTATAGTVYNFISGRITGWIDCPILDVYSQVRSDQEHVRLGEKIDANAWYLPDGIKTARPIFDLVLDHMIAADGIEAVSFALPTGSKVESLPDGELWPDEDELHFSTEAPGTFAFRLYLPFPYQDFVEVVIHAT